MQRPILIASVMRPIGETGVRSHLRALLAYLQRERIPHAIATPFDAPAWFGRPLMAVRLLLEPLGGTAAVWWYRRVYAWLLRGVLRRRLRDGEPCVIYAQCPPSADAALQARRNAGQCVVMVVHFNESQADEWATMRRIAPDGRLFRAIRADEERVLPRVDALVFVSRFMHTRLLARIPAIACLRHAIVPNFVDASPTPHDASASAPDGDLIAIGTLEPRKNQRYLLAIVAAAHRAGRPFTLTVLGDGPDRAALEALARELGIAHAVRFAGYQPDARAWLRAHRALVHGARIENLPITLIEAMAESRPVFAVPVGGVGELFADGVQGRFLPADDAQAAATLIADTLADRATMQGMGEAAHARFGEHYETARAASRLCGFLSSVRARTAPRGDGS